MKTITANKTEQRDWVINKGDMPQTRTKEGRCKYCKKKLSIYNMGAVCFATNCQIKRQKQEDMQYQENARESAKHQRELNKKYYERKKRENISANS